MNHSSWSRVRPISFYALSLLLFGAGVAADRFGLLPPGPGQPPRDVSRTFAPFWEAWNLVQQSYVDRQAVQPQRMTQGAIQGMLASLGDTGHTTYLTANEFEELESGLKGEMEGIGAMMTIRDRQPTVMYVIKRSPAQAGGLRAGDIFLEVDGEPVNALPLDRIVQKVRGRAGTEVTIRVQRKGATKPLDLHIQRARLDVPDVSWHMLPGESAAHLAMRSFGDHADDQLRAALQQARQQGARGLVVDMRGNPGGRLDQAVAGTSEFLRQGDVVLVQDAQGRRRADAVKPGGIAPDIPLVVLIDGGTASSAEIFAGAIQDHKRGDLVGTTTFGTGTVLAPFQLSDGSAVLLAVEEWLTPNGRQIWHHGVTPDVAVKMPEQASVLLPDEEEDMDASALANSKDAQLLKGLAELKKKMQSDQGSTPVAEQPVLDKK